MPKTTQIDTAKAGNRKAAIKDSAARKAAITNA